MNKGNIQVVQDYLVASTGLKTNKLLHLYSDSQHKENKFDK